jgi:hypothetical protein
MRLSLLFIADTLFMEEPDGMLDMQSQVSV